MPGRFRHVSLMVTLGLLSAFTIAGRAEELLRVPLDISSDRLRSREVEGARQWTLDGGHVLRQTGMPELPTLRFEVLIPRDRSVRRLWIEGGTLRSLGKGQSLPTVDALLLPEAETPVREVIYDGAQLDDSPLYPPAEARLSADAFEHGYHVVAVEVAPLRMDRTSGELWWRESPVLMLELEPQRPAVPIVDRLRHDEHWEERILTQLRSRLANPEKLLGYERPAPRMATGKDTPRADKTPSLSDRPVQHLILTTSELASEFQRLADHRIRTGMSSLVVTIDDVLANYRQGVDLAETLRLYIIDAYSKWGVDYVLLGGDSELLPARYVRSTFYPVGSSTDIPADLYYAALDGNWNADGDHIFGEHFASGSDQGDFVDFAAELAVGRAPVSNLGEAALFIDKILDYELPADSNHQTQAIFASEVLFPADWDGLEIIQLDGASFSEILIDSMLVCDPDMSWSPLRLYENFTPYPGAQPLTKAAVLSGLDSGQYGLYHHIGHGFYFNMSVGDATIGPSDADALSNAPNYFVLYSLNCSSSAFDFECLNERFLLSPGGDPWYRSDPREPHFQTRPTAIRRSSIACGFAKKSVASVTRSWAVGSPFKATRSSTRAIAGPTSSTPCWETPQCACGEALLARSR